MRARHLFCNSPTSLGSAGIAMYLREASLTKSWLNNGLFKCCWKNTEPGTYYLPPNKMFFLVCSFVFKSAIIIVHCYIYVKCIPIICPICRLPISYHTWVKFRMESLHFLSDSEESWEHLPYHKASRQTGNTA